MKKFKFQNIKLSFRLLLVVSTVAGSPVVVYSQSSEGYKKMIQWLDDSNYDLEILRQERNVNQIENRIGLNPPNPTVGINYLKPHPRLKDHRFDYSISQDFEFPSVYGQKRKLANAKTQLDEISFKYERSALIQSLLFAWSEWVSYQKKLDFMRAQQVFVNRLLESTETLFKQGEISILERNKVQVFALNFQKNLELEEIETESIFQGLLLYNQGEHIPFLTPEYPVPFKDFTALSELIDLENRSLSVQTIEQMIVVNQSEINLQRAKNLPEWSIGFMREQDIEVDFRGVTLGMSIPLWQNKNQLKSVKVKQNLLENRRSRMASTTHLRLLQLSKKQNAMLDYYQELEVQTKDDRRLELVHKAFELGEMTLGDYLIEQNLLIELREKRLEAELELCKIWIELRKDSW